MALWDQMANTTGQDFSGEATNPGYAGLSPVELGGLGVPGYEAYSGTGGQSSLWDRLTDALGAFPKTSMPGTTVGAPAGQTPTSAPAMPKFPAGPTPPGMGAYFQALQNPPRSGGNLMAQYAALQQLMRGS
jgi:hypothetical protein